MNSLFVFSLTRAFIVSFPSFPLAVPHIKANTYASKHNCNTRLSSAYLTSICELYKVTTNNAHINALVIFLYICYLHLEICENMNRSLHIFTHLYTFVQQMCCIKSVQHTSYTGAFSSPELRCKCIMFICLYLHISIYLLSLYSVVVITSLLYWPSR